MKNKLVQRVANRVNMNQKDVKAVFEALIDEIKDQVKAGNKVSIQMFGTFSAKQRKGGFTQHPLTKEKIAVPERKVPHYRASQKFRDWINE
jgi:nucleoid DNA-binding protein